MQLQKKTQMSVKKIMTIEKEVKLLPNNDSKVYIRLTENEIKKRIAVHKTTFKIDPNKKNHLKYKNSTELSKEIHKLKEKNQEYEILWKIIKQIRKTRQGKAICKPCLTEALAIL